jgi:hypothetical protein
MKKTTLTRHFVFSSCHHRALLLNVPRPGCGLNGIFSTSSLLKRDARTTPTDNPCWIDETR